MKSFHVDDQWIENVVGQLLRAGVLLSAAVVLSGAALYIVRHGHEPAEVRTFHGEPSTLETIGGIVLGAIGGSARAIIQLGLILLIATPVARVAFAAAAFAFERDYLYVIITLLVLAILLYSLFGSSP